MSDLKDQVIAESKSVYRGTDMFDKFFIFHDCLSLWWTKVGPGPHSNGITITVRLCASGLRTQTIAISAKLLRHVFEALAYEFAKIRRLIHFHEVCYSDRALGKQM